MVQSTINERLKVFCDRFDISQAVLRKKLSVRNTAQVSQWFNNREPIPDRMIVKFIRLYENVNARWLITGEGEMIEGRKESGHGVKEEPGEYRSMGECRECKLKDEILRTQMKTINRLEEINEDQRAEIKRLKGEESDNQQIAV